MNLKDPILIIQTKQVEFISHKVRSVGSETYPFLPQY